MTPATAVKTAANTAIDWESLGQQQCQTTPFTHVVMPRFIREQALPGVVQDFPKLSGGGSYPVEHVQGGSHFNALIEALQSDTMREHFARLFSIDLTGKPTTITVRGHTREKDGKIHADSTNKLITVLIYLNQQNWDADGGRLRLLNSPSDMDDYAVEAPPTGGTLMAFLNSPTAYHGHKPYAGPRQSIQLNWVTGAGAVSKSRWRHRLSALFKRK